MRARGWAQVRGFAQMCLPVRGTSNAIGVAVTGGEYFPDPAPGEAKDFVAQWTCGSDPTIRIVSLPAEASGSTAFLDCP